MVKPLLKWVGGKTQIIDAVIGHFPDTIHGDYYEPFVGGGSVLLAALSSGRIHGKVYANDLNRHLIDFYRRVQSEPEELITDLRRLVNEFAEITGDGTINRKPQNFDEAITSKESYYYWVRALFNKDPSPAMFLFLNKTCFRGVYREGPHGFNVPYGHNTNPYVFTDTGITEVSKLIQDVVFTCLPFDTHLEDLKPDDFVYMDPPYVPEKLTSFVGYTGVGFGKEQHELLFATCGTLPCKFLLSNSDVQTVRDAFENFTVHVVSCRRAINSKNPAARANELLITN
jgi:DNA adenine methylase